MSAFHHNCDIAIERNTMPLRTQRATPLGFQPEPRVHSFRTRSETAGKREFECRLVLSA